MVEDKVRQSVWMMVEWKDAAMSGEIDDSWLNCVYEWIDVCMGVAKGLGKMNET